VTVGSQRAPASPAGVIRHGHLPVPYVAAWSSETDIVIRPEPLADDRPAVFRSGARGAGVPLFGLMSESRCRQVVVLRKCQVCRASTRGLGFVVDVPYGSMHGWPLIMEPPTCERCFRLSLELCPGIKRLLADKNVLIARVRDYEPVAVTLGAVESGGSPDLQAALLAWKGPPPIGYIMPALTNYEPIQLDQSTSPHASPQPSP
jgi:hypothetical protein